jgi:hypothetical protein
VLTTRFDELPKGVKDEIEVLRKISNPFCASKDIFSVFLLKEIIIKGI